MKKVILFLSFSFLFFSIAVFSKSADEFDFLLKKNDIKIEFDKEIISEKISEKLLIKTFKFLKKIYREDFNLIINEIQFINLSKGVRYYNKEKYFLILKNENSDIFIFGYKPKIGDLGLIYFSNKSKYPILNSKKLEKGTLKDISRVYLERIFMKNESKEFFFEKEKEFGEDSRYYTYIRKINGFYSKFSESEVFLKENGFLIRFDNTFSLKYNPLQINFTFDQAKQIAVKKYYEIRKNKIASYRKRGYEISPESTKEVEVKPLEYIDINKEYVGIYEHFLGRKLLDEVVNKKRPIYLRPNYNFFFEEEDLPKSGILPKIKMPNDQNYESIFYYDENINRFLNKERLVYPILLVSDDHENFINEYCKQCNAFLVIIYIDAETGEMIGGM